MKTVIYLFCLSCPFPVLGWHFGSLHQKGAGKYTSGACRDVFLFSYDIIPRCG